jgi:hypothetical protein
LRTQWYTHGGQRGSEDRSPPSMAERWRGWSPAGHLRPRNGQWKGARAPVSHGEQDVRARRERGGAERSGPRSGKLRRARPELR